MRCTPRSLAVLLLVLVIAATSGAMAVARGQARGAAGSIVLCTGTGPVPVAVDAQGRPIGPVHVCPDCALSLFAAAVSAPVLPARPMTARRLEWRPVHFRAGSFAAVAARARAPPLT